jgi:hypothetical protein
MSEAGTNPDLPPEDRVGFWSGLRELYRALSPHRRRQFYWVLALMVAGAFAELTAIGSVLPFLTLLTDPHRVTRFPVIAGAFDALGATGDGERLAAAAGLFTVFRAQ